MKHLSFDLWLTLIKSNPLFKQKRAEMIIDVLELEGVDAEMLDAVVRQRDKIFDRYNELKNTKIPAREMYLYVLRRLCPKRKFDISDAEEIVHRSDELLFKYLPEILNNNILPMLDSLRGDFSLNISSNTGFIEAPTLMKVLKRLGLNEFFSFFVFSDEVGCSKPSAGFFRHIHERAGVAKHEILHIGDNPKNDYRGALDYGFKALLIPNSNYNINDIKSAI